MTLKNLLIISPHFPPVNAADMHRIRQSIWYFESLGWKPSVVCVDEKWVETAKDSLLLQTIPPNLMVYKTNALSSGWTRKIGLGALALRSLLFYFFLGNKIIKARKPALIYFSTTQFPVLILGRYWKWRFKTPYIIDMQDPWYSEYYQNKPKSEQPPKYWFSYRLNKYLEPIAMKNADGIIAVSQGYCDMLQARYKNITPFNCVVIPFGAFPKDFEVKPFVADPISSTKSKESIVIRYIGRGGNDMHTSLRIVFHAFKLGLASLPNLFSKVKFEFIGTSYASAGKGLKTIAPLAADMGLSQYVNEMTDRIPYFETLQLLQNADILLIPGSNDPNYTASKLYPYIMAKKPILAVFSETSSVVNILKLTKAGELVTFGTDESENQKATAILLEKWTALLQKIPFVPDTDWKAFEPYTALEMTKKQVVFLIKSLRTPNKYVTKVSCKIQTLISDVNNLRPSIHSLYLRFVLLF